MTAFGQALGLVFFAELADKSRLIGLLLVTAFPNRRWPVFWGMTAAYALLDGAAAFLGGRLTGAVPARLLSLGAGVLFIAFGAAALFFAEKAEAGAKKLLERGRGWGPFFLSFVAVSLGELGDRTQLATAALSAGTGSPWGVFAGAMAALVSLNIVTVWLGEHVTRRLPTVLIQRVGGFVFVALGLSMLWSAKG